MTQYTCPPLFQWYCRGCQSVQWHSPKRRYHVLCVVCGHLTHATEVITTWSTDEFEHPPALLPPQHALPAFMKAPAPEPVEPEEPSAMTAEDLRLLMEKEV